MKTLFTLLTVVVFLSSCSDNAAIKKKYAVYFKESDKQLSELSNDRKSKRDTFLNKIHQTDVYKKAIKGEVNTRLLLVMGFISEALAHTTGDVFSFGANVESELDKEEMDFFINSTTLSFNGGFPVDMVKIFDEHIVAYGLYGKQGSVRYDSSGKTSAYMPRDYDVTPLALMLMPKDKTVLDAIAEAKIMGASKWVFMRDCDNSFSRPYLTCLPAYIDYLRTVYPESKYISLYNLIRPLTAHQNRR